jgi:hypothetical protein
LNADDVVETGNLFAYCYNNPINLSDPSGHIPGSPLAWVLAFVFAIVGGAIANYIAVKKGWRGLKRAAFIGACALVSGAIGWLAGEVLAHFMAAYLSAHTALLTKMPAFVLWLIGLGSTSSLADEIMSKSGGHIFSADHIKNGIMELGSSQADIVSKIARIIQPRLAKAAAGPNEIRTLINGCKVTIRFFIQDGKILSFNAMIGWGERILGNLLK